MKRSLAILFWTAASLSAATIDVPCNSSTIASAIAGAAPGDIVSVAAGTCSLSGITISGITLQGAGKGTNGTIITGGMVTINKHASQITRLTGFRFTGGGNFFTVSTGGSTSTRAYRIDNNYFASDGSTQLGNNNGDLANGGVIDHNDFVAPNNNNADFWYLKPWETWQSGGPATFGTEDTQGPQGGERNIYIEDNTFTNLVCCGPDGDRGARLVIRYNTYTDSSIVFHSSAPADSGDTNGGTRQFEIYGNHFVRSDPNVPLDKWIWVRGASGVVANNIFDSPNSSQYGGKTTLKLTLVCNSSVTTYPVPYQVGQSSANNYPSGVENPPSHPVLIFGNTGAGASGSFIGIAGSADAGGDCSHPQDYIQQGRDYFLDNSNHWKNGSGQAYSWTPFTYPHPLVGTSTIGTFSPCDVNKDGVINSTDYQLEINQALGLAACTADINLDGICNVVDVQRVSNAVGGQCVSP